MKENKSCIKCSVPLVVGENTTQYRIDHYQYLCTKCSTKHTREYHHQNGIHRPMSKNRECALFLGVHVAERVLSRVFRNVVIMPLDNPGYTFICGNGYLVGVKSACRHHNHHRADNWLFHIFKNQVAEYFICLAFDNRTDLIPEHIWLIPGGDINHLTTTSISEIRLDRWKKYEQPVGQVMACCDTLR